MITRAGSPSPRGRKATNRDFGHPRARARRIGAKVTLRGGRRRSSSSSGPSTPGTASSTPTRSTAPGTSRSGSPSTPTFGGMKCDPADRHPRHGHLRRGGHGARLADPRAARRLGGDSKSVPHHVRVTPRGDPRVPARRRSHLTASWSEERADEAEEVVRTEGPGVFGATASAGSSALRPAHVCRQCFREESPWTSGS